MLPVNTKDKICVPFVAWKMNDGVGQCEMSQDGARETSLMTSRMISPVLMSRSSCRSRKRGVAEAIVKPEPVFTFALGSVCH